MRASDPYDLTTVDTAELRNPLGGYVDMAGCAAQATADTVAPLYQLAYIIVLVVNQPMNIITIVQIM